MKTLLWLAVFIPLLLAGMGCKKQSRKIIGIKLYEYSDDFNSLSKKWVGMGINTAFLSRELAANPDFRKILKDSNIDVYVIFPVYYDTARLRQDTLLYAITNTGKKAKDDWVEFVCPSRKSFRDLKVNEAREIVRQLSPEGLSIDFIREFVFWEMIYPDRDEGSIESACYCDSCLAAFCRMENIEFPDSLKVPGEKADFIIKSYAGKWNAFRTSLIADAVKEIAESVRDIQPGIKINVHAVPWRDQDFGGANIRVAAQDLNKIAPFVDYISPMCYSQMVRRNDRWIASVVEEMDTKAAGKILPSIQVYPYYIDDTFTPQDFGRCIDAALSGNSRGVVFFSWPLFEKDPMRIDVVKEKYNKGAL